VDRFHNYGLKVGYSPSLGVVWFIFQATTAKMAGGRAAPKGYPAYRAKTAGDKSDFFPTGTAKCQVGRRIYNFCTGQTLGWKNYVTDII
jgi:hypothetical protein